MDITLNTVVFARDVGVLDLSLRRLVCHTPEPFRLAIWVNGSSKAVREYCDDFARNRENTEVHFSKKNVGHGDALDELMALCETEYFVCFDMDSFPTATGWIDDLAGRIRGDVKCAGVIERAVGKRNRWGEYVHPSCLMIRVEDFEALKHPKHGLQFGGLSCSRADVGEMITVNIMRRGLRTDGWRFTHNHFPELRWGFRHYGGYWCHVWMVSQMFGQGLWHGHRGTDWVHSLYGASPERLQELTDNFLDEMAPQR